MKYLLIIVAVLLAFGLGQTSGERMKEHEKIYTDTTYIFEKVNVDTKMLAEAFIQVESGGRDSAVNKSGAVGCLQIMPICVQEANRILGHDKFKLNDRYSRHKSLEMFHVIMRHKNPNYELAKACNIWNPNGKTIYTAKVEEAYKELTE